MGIPLLARYVAVQKQAVQDENRWDSCAQEQLAHWNKLKVMTEKPETDVNKDYITPPV